MAKTVMDIAATNRSEIRARQEIKHQNKFRHKVSSIFEHRVTLTP